MMAYKAHNPYNSSDLIFCENPPFNSPTEMLTSDHFFSQKDVNPDPCERAHVLAPRDTK